MRLNAYLARSGVCSRRRADELIAAGRVRVNGERAALHTVVQPGDVVELDGRRVEPEPLAYVLLHKPAGVVTTAHDPQGRRTVVDLLPKGPRVVPVGRLDRDTTGALLLTNDGLLAHRLAHPRYEVAKVYEAVVEGVPTSEALEALRRGVELEDGRTAPAAARVLEVRADSSLLELVLHEGRRHQVKRMCEAVGHPVRRLHRSAYAGLGVADLRPGESRPLAPEEVRRLRELVGLERAATRTRRSSRGRRRGRRARRPRRASPRRRP
ncbi:MAG: pseudouridine synthase [Thermoleophilia bacterium]|nr:rRNA pseudouridine synthase [Gaiellaceae bacterium]MDW8338714.1 pseudouridine synthase [Thermoleophilia bacterium]